MNAIKHYRKKAGLTQAELAKKCNISKDSVVRYESGHREPRASDIQKLCEVLGVGESELLNGSEDGGEIKFSFVLNISEVSTMDIKMNEFKLDSVVTRYGPKSDTSNLYSGKEGCGIFGIPRGNATPTLKV